MIPSHRLPLLWLQDEQLEVYVRETQSQRKSEMPFLQPDLVEEQLHKAAARRWSLSRHGARPPFVK